MPKVKVGDINMYYEIHGHGEPVVFIHGIGGNMKIWFRHIPVYSDEFKVIVFDNRGLGRSDAPDIPYTMAMLADDLAGLLDINRIISTHIIGLSLGGGVAQRFALRYPERVVSLTLVSTDCGLEYGIQSKMENNTETERDSELTPEERRKKIALSTYSEGFIEKNPEIVQQYNKMFREYPPPLHGFRRLGDAFSNMNTYEKLPDIKAPTLILHGEDDKTILAENARLLASRIPGAELVIFKNIRHGVMYEAFEESNRVILDFLRRHSPNMEKS
jgi:3-oxoadipate enol-lactonase